WASSSRSPWPSAWWRCGGSDVRSSDRDVTLVGPAIGRVTAATRGALTLAMIRPLSRRLAALAALLLLVVAAGCGTESGAVGAADVDPREAVRAAFAELDPSVLDVSVSVDATADEILT